MQITKESSLAHSEDFCSFSLVICENFCFVFRHCFIFLQEDDDSSSDDEDDTAELLAELQKIKKERANEKARLVRFQLLAIFFFVTLVQNIYRKMKQNSSLLSFSHYLIFFLRAINLDLGFFFLMLIFVIIM